MEINVTKFIAEAAPKDYSASVAELGQDAGRVTWGHAVEDSAEYMLLDTEEKREAFRSWVAGFGAWSDEEIAGWPDIELNALFLQFIASEQREHGLTAESTTEDWAAYEHSDTTGNLFRAEDGEIYFQLG